MSRGRLIVALCGFGLVALVCRGRSLADEVAIARSDPALDPRERAAVLRSAQDIFFDNPIEQVLVASTAVVAVRAAPEVSCIDDFGPGATGGRTYIVEAFSYFAVPIGTVRVTCDGSSSRLESGDPAD